MRALPLLVLLVLASCTPSTVTPSPDASASTAACANLAAAGCALGRNPQCANVVELAIKENHTTRDVVACVASAANKAAIGNCSAYFACP